MRTAIVAIALVGLICLGSSALANSDTRLVMHGIETAFGVCEIADPCEPGPPTVDVPVGSTIAAYLLIHSHQSVAGVQTAFEWGQWVFLFGLWDCQVGQVSGVTPAPPGGPTAGTIATAFDVITGPGSGIIGRMHLVATTPGCINQVLSSYPFGNHVVDDQAWVTEIWVDYWGSICAGSGQGMNTCGPSSTPVEPSTWGGIKAQYN